MGTDNKITVISKELSFRNSVVVQWLGPCASTAGGMGSIPGQGTKIPQAAWCGQRKKKRRKEISFQSPSLNSPSVDEGIPRAVTQVLLHSG